jgi:uncharacterized SAM-binding protein YcdF (DUF218 family)
MHRDSVMMIYTFLRSLLTPPAVQILLILIGLACVYRGHRWWGRSLVCLGVVTLWLMATPLGAALLARGLEVYPALPVKSELAARHWQAIVVLGGGRDDAAAEYAGEDIPNRWTASRLRYAAFLYRQSALPIAVSGGAVHDEAVPEADIMAASLVRDYVVNVRWKEGASATTWENAFKTKALLKPEGIERIVLVTQAQHMPRAVLAFQHAGFTVLPAPIDFATSNLRMPLLLQLTPQAKCLLLSAQASHEYMGLLFYRLRILMG